MAKINKSQKDKIKKFKDITEVIRSRKSEEGRADNAMAKSKMRKNA